MRIAPDTCRDPDLLAAEVRRLRAALDALRREVRDQRREIAALRDERAALLAAERPTISLNLTDDPPKAVDSPSDAVSCVGKSVENDIPEAWLARPHWVDPPSGWQYGFPRLYDPQSDGEMTAWMIAHGYPEKLARQNPACTFTAASDGAIEKRQRQLPSPDQLVDAMHDPVAPTSGDRIRSRRVIRKR